MKLLAIGLNTVILNKTNSPWGKDVEALWIKRVPILQRWITRLFT